MRPDDELPRGLETDGRPEIAEGEGDGPSEVDVAGIPQQPHPRVGPVLDDGAGREPLFPHAAQP